MLTSEDEFGDALAALLERIEGEDSITNVMGWALSTPTAMSRRGTFRLLRLSAKQIAAQIPLIETQAEKGGVRWLWLDAYTAQPEAQADVAVVFLFASLSKRLLTISAFLRCLEPSQPAHGLWSEGGFLLKLSRRSRAKTIREWSEIAPIKVRRGAAKRWAQATIGDDD